MKKQKSLNGLRINKETIAHLTQAEMIVPRGGIDIPEKTVDFTDCVTNCFQCPTQPSKCPVTC